MDFPRGSVVKNLRANTGDVDSISGLGKSPGEGNGNPLQYSCLENPTDRGAWWVIVYGVTKDSGTTWWLTSKQLVLMPNNTEFLPRRFQNKRTGWEKQLPHIHSLGCAWHHAMSSYAFSSFLLIVVPDVWIPEWEEKASKTMQLAKRGSLLLTRTRALCRIQHSGAGQRAPSPSCYTNL